MMTTPVQYLTNSFLLTNIHYPSEGFRDVLVPETSDVVFEENNGKLVLISGPLVISDPLKDTTYGVSINAVKLRKVVQVSMVLLLVDK